MAILSRITKFPRHKSEATYTSCVLRIAQVRKISYVKLNWRHRSNTLLV